ncbi:MAG: hypothetical protein V4649_11290 [Bacteroidota bacterium]
MLTLVHPDFLPPVYATAQVLRDIGYKIHILTFDSFVPAHLGLGGGIELESVGKHHGISTPKRIALRRKFTARAKQLAGENPLAIITFCPFSFLCGLKVKGSAPLIYSALEVADFMLPIFLKSPLSNYNNLRALKNMHRADVVTTPSVQRSAWLAGRCHLDFVPYTVLNTAYLPPHNDGPHVGAGLAPALRNMDDTNYDVFKSLIPGSFLDKKIILYTGAVNDHLCVMELVKAFDTVADEASALVITGIKDNEYCNSIKDYAAKCKSSSRIQLLPYVTRAEMLSLQANADIGVCLAKEYDNNVESKMMAPNKVGEYLAKGLYLLGVKNEYLTPIKWKGLASLADTTAPADIATALGEALHSVQGDNYKQAIRNFVEEYFCMQQQLKPVINYIEAIKQA